MKWIKPVGVSRFHIFATNEDGVITNTVCGRNYHLDGREIREDSPSEELKCEECKEKL